MPVIMAGRVEKGPKSGITVMIEQAEAAKSAKPKVRELRQSPRKKSLLPATLITDAGPSECHVLDLSRGGARVSSSVVVVEEQAVTLIVKPIGTFAGLVAWRGERGFGVKFLAQHGASSPTPSALEAALHGAAETPRKAPAADREGDAAALLRKVETAHSDEVPSEPAPAKRARKPRPPAPERLLELHHGDIICLLRKKTEAGEGEGETKPASGKRRRERLRVKDLSHCELIELDGKHFMALIERRSAFSIELMRVVSSAAQREEKHSGANGSEPPQGHSLECEEPEAAPNGHRPPSRAPKAVA